MAVTLTVKPTIISLTVAQTPPVTLAVGREKISFDVYSVLPCVSGGDMFKSIYDIDNDGIVDEAEKVDGGSW